MHMQDQDTDIASNPEDLPAREAQLSILGDFAVHQFRSPVCICTLTDDTLRDTLMHQPELEGVVIGSLHTENIGIEHIISYCVGNPNVRFVLLCGQDGQQAVGHLPGQSFLSLYRNGLDQNGTMIGAQGKRPVIRNISHKAVAHFRNQVELVDLIGCSEVETILETFRACVKRNPGLAEGFEQDAIHQKQVETVEGYVPDRMITDPLGYFIIEADHPRGLMTVEHYTNQGVFDWQVEGKTAQSIYTPILDSNLVSRLDHAAYLGRELARGEAALKSGQPYVQDA